MGLEEQVNDKFAESWRKFESEVGEDWKDFIPIGGAINYIGRAWPVVFPNGIKEGLKNDGPEGFYFGYMDKVTLAQFTYMGVISAWGLINYFG